MPAITKADAAIAVGARPEIAIFTELNLDGVTSDWSKPAGHQWLRHLMTRNEPTLPDRAADAASDDAVSEELPYRSELRALLENIWVEKATVALVLVYMLLVLIDLVIENVAAWSRFFLYVDFAFLCVFVAEHTIRFYAYGLPYMCAAIPPSPVLWLTAPVCAELSAATPAQAVRDEGL
jgi:hypothetical protein